MQHNWDVTVRAQRAVQALVRLVKVEGDAVRIAGPVVSHDVLRVSMVIPLQIVFPKQDWAQYVEPRLQDLVGGGVEEWETGVEVDKGCAEDHSGAGNNTGTGCRGRFAQCASQLPADAVRCGWYELVLRCAVRCAGRWPTAFFGGAATWFSGNVDSSARAPICSRVDTELNRSD